MASILNQSGQLNTFDPTITKSTPQVGRRTMPSLSGSTLQPQAPATDNWSGDAEWEALRDSRIANNADTMNTVTADNYSYSEGGGGLTNAQAGAIGAGIEGASMIAEGVIGNVKGKKNREAAVAEAEKQLALRREERADQWELEDQQIASQKEQARYEQAMQNNVLRLNMFERDFAKEMQRYQDQQEAMARFNQNATDNEAFKMAIAQRMGNM